VKGGRGLEGTERAVENAMREKQNGKKGIRTDAPRYFRATLKEHQPHKCNPRLALGTSLLKLLKYRQKTQRQQERHPYRKKPRNTTPFQIDSGTEWLKNGRGSASREISGRKSQKDEWISSLNKLGRVVLGAVYGCRCENGDEKGASLVGGGGHVLAWSSEQKSDLGKEGLKTQQTLGKTASIFMKK